jgi:hypothetical protein
MNNSTRKDRFVGDFRDRRKVYFPTYIRKLGFEQNELDFAFLKIPHYYALRCPADITSALKKYKTTDDTDEYRLSWLLNNGCLCEEAARPTKQSPLSPGRRLLRSAPKKPHYVSCRKKGASALWSYSQ